MPVATRPTRGRFAHPFQRQRCIVDAVGDVGSRPVAAAADTLAMETEAAISAEQGALLGDRQRRCYPGMQAPRKRWALRYPM